MIPNTYTAPAQLLLLLLLLLLRNYCAAAAEQSLSINQSIGQHPTVVLCRGKGKENENRKTAIFPPQV